MVSTPAFLAMSYLSLHLIGGLKRRLSGRNSVFLKSVVKIQVALESCDRESFPFEAILYTNEFKNAIVVVKHDNNKNLKI